MLAGDATYGIAATALSLALRLYAESPLKSLATNLLDAV